MLILSVQIIFILMNTIIQPSLDMNSLFRLGMWLCGSNGRVPTWKAQGLEFKPSNPPLPK
jgi:hypothetical protein